MCIRDRFKRYQIQNVWRADRPQKGRYREFLQCDADVIGSKSMMQEIDFISLFDSVFNDLNLEGCLIKINSRKLLYAICEINDCIDKFGIITNQLDKLDKTDVNVVKNNLTENGFDIKIIDSLFEAIDLSKNFYDTVSTFIVITSMSILSVKYIFFPIDNFCGFIK